MQDTSSSIANMLCWRSAHNKGNKDRSCDRCNVFRTVRSAWQGSASSATVTTVASTLKSARGLRMRTSYEFEEEDSKKIEEEEEEEEKEEEEEEERKEKKKKRYIERNI